MPSSRYIRLLNDLCHGCAACSAACESGAIENSSTVVGTVSSYKYQNSVCLAEGRMTTGHPSPVKLIKATMKNAFQKRSDLNMNFMIRLPVHLVLLFKRLQNLILLFW